MKLNILTGRSGTGKTTKIILDLVNKINAKCKENLILFVPDQMSFQAEYEVAKKVNNKTFSNFQVLSFKRLAYRLFLEVGGANKIFVNDLAINMMIMKIIQDNKDKFTIYNKLTNNSSFVSLVYEVIKEFKSYQISPDLINNILDKDSTNETLKKKLYDINIIYQELINLYGKELIDDEDFYTELGEKINNSNYIKNSTIYVDGYHSFTTVELNVIFNLIKTAKEVTILFTIDDVRNEDLSNSENLFNLPFRNLKKILNFADENQIEVNINHFSNDKKIRFKADELHFLERNFHGNNTQFNGEVKNIEVFECENPTSEVHAVARKIYNDILENHTMYSDYVIYTNNEEVYYPLIKNIFKQYEIPIFIDDKKLMLDHSLLNFVDAILEVVKTNWSHEAIFRAIKTEMFIPLEFEGTKLTEKNYNNYVNLYRFRIDTLENYCLAHGIKGKDWYKEYWEIDLYKKIYDIKKVKTDKELEKERILNLTKNEITEPLIKFFETFKKASNVLDQVTAIYDLLININVTDKLDLYERVDINKSETAIDLNNSKKHKQVYNKLVELFDQLVEVCGNYKIETKEFIKVLQTGFNNMKFTIVPPVLDQIMIGTIKRSRFEMMGHLDDPTSIGVKKAFVVGVNENEIPKIYNESGLITNSEREFLNDNDFEIMPTLERTFLDEYFVIYTVLTSPQEKLSLSYTLSNSDKKESIRSELIDNISCLFPKLKINTLYDFPHSQDEEINFQYITSKGITTSNLLSALNLSKNGYHVHDIWKEVYSYYLNNKELAVKLSGSNYYNNPIVLDKEDILKTYGDIINSSISSVEKFNSCPYSFYLEKGLGIKERDEQKMESLDIGDLYHETMKDIAQYLINNKKGLQQLDINKIPQLVNDIVEKYAQKMQRNYFNNNKRNSYLLFKIKATLVNSLKVMHYQSTHTQFNILAVEEKFGIDAKRLKISPKRLINGFTMQLKGFIDRIDVANIDNKSYIRIIDYKSGNKDIDFTKIYNRLSLQLLTYLDVVLANSNKLFNKEAIPAGILYYHLYNSQVNANFELTKQDIESKHNEEYKMNGYTVKDANISKLFDDKLGDIDKSDIIKVAFTKKGYHKSHSKVLTIEDLLALRKYTNKAIEDSVTELTNGKLAIQPVKYNNVATCKYCKYHSICKFDPKLKENQYKEISKIGDRDEIIEMIKKEVGDLNG